MAYEEIYRLFVENVERVGLDEEFTASWRRDLESALPSGEDVLAVPEFAFFAVFVQRYVSVLGNRERLREFVDEVAQVVEWVKGKPRGRSLARRLAQKSPDGPLSALLEMFTVWRFDRREECELVELEPELSGGRALDARVRCRGKEVLIECFASMTSEMAVSGKLDGFWHPATDPVIAKIRGKIWDKAEQAKSASSPAVLVIAPSVDFLIPAGKIPPAVASAFEDERTESISAVLFTGGEHPFLFESVACVFENPRARVPLPGEAAEVFECLAAGLGACTV